MSNAELITEIWSPLLIDPLLALFILFHPRLLLIILVSPATSPGCGLVPVLSDRQTIDDNNDNDNNGNNDNTSGSTYRHLCPCNNCYR